ncbi:DnaB-like replicative helicase [Psuedomonas phage SVOphi44]
MLKHKKEFQRLHKIVNQRAFDLRTTTVLGDFGRYFDAFPDCQTVPLGAEFDTWFVLQHRNLKDEDMAVYRQVFKQVAGEPSDEVKAVLVSQLLDADIAVQAADIADRWSRGEEINISGMMRKLMDDYELEVKRKINIPFVEIGDNLFKDAVNNTGISWRQSALNLTMRRLRPGDFGILAARPDAGKTSFVASEITHMAKEIRGYFGENRPIIWFNNEGPGDRIMERIIQAAFGIPASQLVKKQKAGTIWTEYAALIGGWMQQIRVVDIHGYKAWQVEEIVKQQQPSIVVFDMIDNIRFDGEVMNGGQRTDQLLEAMYQWARILCTQHKCIGIATSQISAEGDGLAYPTLGMLKDSKTGKQGAADFIITLGKKNEEAYEAIRFLGLTKNKLHCEGQKRSPAAEIIFDATAGRFYSAKENHVNPNAGRGNDNQAVVQTEGQPVRQGQLGSVDGSQAAVGDSGLQPDQRTRDDQGLAETDVDALLAQVAGGA